MKQFGTIFRFECKNYLKNKIFVGVTVFLIALIAAVMFFPRILSLFESTKEPMPEDRPVMLISAGTENAAAVQEAFAAAFGEYQIVLSENGIGGLREKVESGEAECAFAIESPTSYRYYVKNLSMYDEKTYAADEVLRSLYRIDAMTKAGLSETEAGEILAMPIQHETETLGKDQFQNFFYTYIMIFALYMVILLYGQMVAMNVATEKSSRAMELLITSAKPTAMMFGKVFASCLAGLTQLICVFGSAILFFNCNKEYWGENPIINSIFNMPTDLLLYMILFFILGFFIYAFLYGAIGSTASKLEDINTSVMPITMLFIIAFFIVIFSMTSGNINSVVMRVCSYIPFTSPMAMFTRIAMSAVPAYEILLSVVILVASVVGVGVLSAKIYRVGVLLYGTTPKIGTLLKSIRNAK